MASRRIDRNIEDLISNLKLTQPNKTKPTLLSLNQENIPLLSSQTTAKTAIQSMPTSYTDKKLQQPIWKQLVSRVSITNNPNSEYDSVVNDTYDDTNNYSFYQLKQLRCELNQQNAGQFSFCQQFESQQSNDDSLNRFSSIVDKLKTQGDQSDSIDANYFFYDHYDEPHSQQLPKTDRFICKEQPYFSESENSKITDRKKNQYFSGSLLKSTQKSYKNISKKSFQTFSKAKAQPIYAKLILTNDKENNQQNSNICPKNSIISALTTKKSNYSSVMKKPFNPVTKSSVKSTQQCPLSRAKVKELNQKIRKENQIVYTSELKQKYQDVSPLQSFKKSTIQPHKFSSYKAKLFC